MKNTIATTALVLVAALSAGSVFAADSSVRARPNVAETSGFFDKATPSTVSRAEVKGEVVAAVQARTGLSVKETSSHFAKSAPSVLSRAEVKAELSKAGSVSAVDYRG